MQKQPSTKSKKPRKSTKRIAKKKRDNRILLYASLLSIVSALLIGIGYYMGLQSAKEIAVTKSSSPIVKREKNSTIVKSNSAGFSGDRMIDKLQKKQKKHKVKSIEKRKVSSKPKLVIIIDDVSQKWQIESIKNLPFHITPSIFPPSNMSEHSNKLSSLVSHFMVHLPMQSSSAKMNKMRGTILLSHSKERLKKRIAEIKRLFPKAKYINNHTGSVFTSNYSHMKSLYKIMRDKGYTFIDSRTSGKTKVGRIAKEYGDRYIARDIFIDNTQTKAYIIKQLKKAVSIAKKKGYAIAIGHPHRITLKTLKRVKTLLKDVDVVYVDELF